MKELKRKASSNLIMIMFPILIILFGIGAFLFARFVTAPDNIISATTAQQSNNSIGNPTNTKSAQEPYILETGLTVGK